MKSAIVNQEQSSHIHYCTSFVAFICQLADTSLRVREATLHLHSTGDTFLLHHTGAQCSYLPLYQSCKDTLIIITACLKPTPIKFRNFCKHNSCYGTLQSCYTFRDSSIFGARLFALQLYLTAGNCLASKFKSPVLSPSRSPGNRYRQIRSEKRNHKITIQGSISLFAMLNQHHQAQEERLLVGLAGAKPSPH